MSHDASTLLRAEFAAHLPERPVSASRELAIIERPSSDLVASLEEGAQAAGVTPNSVDWATVIPAVIAAIASKNPLAIITTLAPLAGPAIAFILGLLKNFHKQPSVNPGTGPAITGS